MLVSSTINKALRIIGVLTAGEEAAPAEHQDALGSLNGLLESFNNQGLMIPISKLRAIQAPYVLDPCLYSDPDLSAGGRAWKNKIVIGLCTNSSDVDINEAAPLEVRSCFFRESITDPTLLNDLDGGQAGSEFPGDALDGGAADSVYGNVTTQGDTTVDHKLRLMSQNDWSRIMVKSSVATPSAVYAQYGERKMTIYFDTIPNPGSVFYAFTREAFASNLVATDDVTWDDGYERMIALNLAVELAAEYGVQIRPDTLALAAKAVDDIKAKNHDPLTLTSDTGLIHGSKGYDIYSGPGNY